MRGRIVCPEFRLSSQASDILARQSLKSLWPHSLALPAWDPRTDGTEGHTGALGNQCAAYKSFVQP